MNYNDYKGETRLYELMETNKVYKFPKVHCVFCKHCKDLFYDYTNGPYMFMCELDCEITESEKCCTCDGFEDTGYIFNEHDYRERMDAKLQEMILINKMMSDENIKKQWDMYMDSFIGAVPGHVKKDGETIPTIYQRERFNKEE